MVLIMTRAQSSGPDTMHPLTLKIGVYKRNWCNGQALCVGGALSTSSIRPVARPVPSMRSTPSTLGGNWPNKPKKWGPVPSQWYLLRSLFATVASPSSCQNLFT